MNASAGGWRSPGRHHQARNTPAAAPPIANAALPLDASSRGSTASAGRRSRARRASPCRRRWRGSPRRGGDVGPARESHEQQQHRDRIPDDARARRARDRRAGRGSRAGAAAGSRLKASARHRERDRLPPRQPAQQQRERRPSPCARSGAPSRSDAARGRCAPTRGGSCGRAAPVVEQVGERLLDRDRPASSRCRRSSRAWLPRIDGIVARPQARRVDLDAHASRARATAGCRAGRRMRVRPPAADVVRPAAAGPLPAIAS